MRILGSRRSAGRAAATEVVARARALDLEDYNRWRALSELNEIEIDIKTMFESAAGLIGSGERDPMVLSHVLRVRPS